MLKNYSKELWKKSLKLIPGGVNSPVRAMSTMGIDPPLIDEGYACFIKDLQGKKYIDYVNSWGALVLGHANPEILEVVFKAAKKGMSFGAPTEMEALLAELLVKSVPSLEKVRLVSSGTEATMSALRLARGFTGKNIVVKFDGCYHGHFDSFLVNAGSGLTSLGVPLCPGVPEGISKNTITLPYNDLEKVEVLFRERGEDIAAIILEPVAGNMGVVRPLEGYLKGIRDLCTKYNIVLIFDEVITGFRLALGGAQEYFGVLPDITTLGKILGGGLPIGAYGGKSEIMDHIAPVGKVYQAGTLSGNPLVTSVAIKTLQLLSREGIYEKLDFITNKLYLGLCEILKKFEIPYYGQRCGSMFSIFFTEGSVFDWKSALACDKMRFRRWFRGMLEGGVYLPPSQYESIFVSLFHGEEEISRTLDIASDVLEGGALDK